MMLPEERGRVVAVVGEGTKRARGRVGKVIGKGSAMLLEGVKKEREGRQSHPREGCQRRYRRNAVGMANIK